MMLRTIAARIGMVALTFLVAAGFYLSAPAPRLEAASCGPGTSLCTENEQCVYILFYKICTTRYTYYPPGPEEMI